MLTFQCTSFSQLSPESLYQIMVLRQEVFVVEQACAYLDADGKDFSAWHLQGFDSNSRLVCYARLLPLGISYSNYVSIGRVVSASFSRGSGAGRALMHEAIKRCRDLFGEIPIKISAQAYLKKFYMDFGFMPTGEEYLEDGIPHLGMILN